jgi:hypothetical protein
MFTSDSYSDSILYPSAQTDTQIQTHHVKLLSDSYSDSVSLAVQIHRHFLVTFIFKFLKVFRFRVGFLMGLMSNLWILIFLDFNIFEVHPARLEVMKFMICTNNVATAP